MAYSVWSRIYFGTWSTGYGEGYTLINGAQGSDEDIMLVHGVQGSDKDIPWYMKYSDKDISWYMEYRVRIGIYFGT